MLGFVIGSGPSILDVDFELIRPYTTLCVNESISRFPEADYFFSCDARITLRKAWKLVESLSCPVIFAQGGSGMNCYWEAIGHKPSEAVGADRLITPPRACKDKFGDPELIWGTNSAHPAANYLYNLGCKTIILLGCDCQTTNGKKYFWEIEGTGGLDKAEYQQCIREEPFHKEIFIKTWSDIALHNDVELINCSSGQIPGIVKKTLSEAIDGCQKNL